MRVNAPRESRVRVKLLLLAGLSAVGGVAASNGCSAVSDTNGFTGDPGSGTGGVTSSSGGGGPGGGTSTGDGGFNPGVGGAGTGGSGGIPVNPCGSECGPTELCDGVHLGLDDDCDGLVDEVCSCQSGQAHACFKGDPSFHNAEGCFDGTEKCTENGTWGPCIGGLHATAEDNCAMGTNLGCHPIQAVPFQTVNLKDGTGTFSTNAVTESWSVACPAGVNPCPAVGGANPADDFQALQSGEYTVTYTKTVQGGPAESCSYPLFVGARGLRVEMEWEWGNTDLDLHVHQPNNVQPWAINGSLVDCGWTNCTAGSYLGGGIGSPSWFSDAAMIPDPVNWYLDPDFNKNTCYFAPRGVGQQWQSFGMGCHNPRLDLDNVFCEPTVSDPDDSSFCAPENINIDFPPINEWTRIGVHYYSGGSIPIHPKIKVYCDGALAADLGQQGYNTPESPVVFPQNQAGTLFWMVADVLFKPADECTPSACVVEPLYLDPATKTPLITDELQAESNFGPSYPPVPMP